MSRKKQQSQEVPANRTHPDSGEKYRQQLQDLYYQAPAAESTTKEPAKES